MSVKGRISDQLLLRPRLRRLQRGVRFDRPKGERTKVAPGLLSMKNCVSVKITLAGDISPGIGLKRGSSGVVTNQQSSDDATNSGMHNSERRIGASIRQATLTGGLTPPQGGPSVPIWRTERWH